MKLFTAFLFSAAFTFSCFSQIQTTPSYMQVGYYGRLSGGVLVGGFNSTSWQISNGFRFRHFEVGMGLGIETFSNGRNAPIFVETRYVFTNKSTQPFVGISGGYLIPLNRYNKNFDSGFTLGASVGLSHFFTSHFGLSWSLGYRIVDIPNYGPYYPTQVDENNLIEARMGIVFR